MCGCETGGVWGCDGGVCGCEGGVCGCEGGVCGCVCGVRMWWVCVIKIRVNSKGYTILIL